MGVQIKSGFTAASQRVAQARAQYQALMVVEVEQVKVQAEYFARQGTLAGVYNTLPGRYVRTELLLESIYATPAIAGGNIGIEVGNRASYASSVEYGSYGEYQSPEELRALAEAAPGFGPLYLGRSGLKWQTPNPAITRAAVLAGHLLGKASSDALKRVFRS
jgi:hypothetical protein